MSIRKKKSPLQKKKKKKDTTKEKINYKILNVSDLFIEKSIYILNINYTIMMNQADMKEDNK